MQIIYQRKINRSYIFVRKTPNSKNGIEKIALSELLKEMLILLRIYIQNWVLKRGTRKKSKSVYRNLEFALIILNG